MIIRHLRLVIFIPILISCSSSKIIINENGFDIYKIGQTKLYEVKKHNSKFKEKKSFKSALYRSAEGKYDVTYYYNWINVKKGKISFLFISNEPTNDSVKLYSITFNKKSSAVTNKGIQINKSTFKDITDQYGDIITAKDSDGYFHKYFDGIEFFSNGLKDSVDEKLIVTGIIITAKRKQLTQ